MRLELPQILTVFDAGPLGTNLCIQLQNFRNVSNRKRQDSAPMPQLA